MIKHSAIISQVMMCFIKSPDNEVGDEACRCLRNYFRYTPVEYAIGFLDGHKELIDFILGQINENTQVIRLLNYTNLLDLIYTVGRHDTVINGNPYVEYTLECECMENLQTIQRTPSEKVYQAVCELLSTHFQIEEEMY